MPSKDVTRLLSNITETTQRSTPTPVVVEQVIDENQPRDIAGRRRIDFNLNFPQAALPTQTGGVELVDIGGGLRQFVPRQQPLSLSELLRLSQGNQDGGQDLLKTQKQILDMQLDLEKARRDNVKFLMETYKELPSVFANSFELGQKIASELGFEAVKNSDGTVGLKIPSQDKKFSFTIIDPNNVASPEKKLEIEQKFRYEYRAAAKEYEDIFNSLKQIKTLSAQKTGIADVGMIYSFMKILDPRSVVREGEIATAQNAGGVPETIRVLYNRTLKGEKLSEVMRNQFVTAANVLAREKRETFLTFARSLSEIVRASKVRPENVVVDVGDVRKSDILFGVTEKPKPKQKQTEKTSTDDLKKIDDIFQNLKRGIFNGQ